MNILFVCTGNVCRSPMAEGFLRHEAARRGLGLAARSTGTHAWHGRAATIDGRRTMAEMGVPIDDHRTEELSQRLVDWAHLIVALSTEHVRDTVRDFPEAAPKTLTLKEVLRVLPVVPEALDESAFVKAILKAHEAEAPLEDPDVADPYGERQEAYRRTAREIQVLIESLADGIQRLGVLTTSAQ